MTQKETEKKNQLHQRNRNNQRYNLDVLVKYLPELESKIVLNPKGEKTLNFADAQSVFLLNKALLLSDYKLKFWDLPKGHLCPPVPGRADYLHYSADLLAKATGKIPTGKKVKVFDIGVGSSCIYPLLGNSEYGWSFIGSDTNKSSIEWAQTLVDHNQLNDSVTLKIQKNPNDYFFGVLNRDEKIDLSICNPPFYGSAEEAANTNLNKTRKLTKGKKHNINYNFGGTANELWCQGGELRFVNDMIFESRKFSRSILWFTSLLSRKEHEKHLMVALKKAGAKQVEIINMSQGNKKSRLLAWSFFTKEQQLVWAKERWT